MFDRDGTSFEKFSTPYFLLSSEVDREVKVQDARPLAVRSSCAMQLLRGLVRPIALAVSALRIARRSCIRAAEGFVPYPHDRDVLLRDGAVSLREAQALVGHPTPFAILRHLFESDPKLVELSSSVRKLYRSRHPLAESARYGA